MGIIYLFTLLLAIAFVIVVIYAAVLLKRVSDTLRTLGKTLGEVETQLKHITPQIRQNIQETGKLVDDVNEKLKETDSVFDTVGNLGNSMNSINHVYREHSKHVTDQDFERKMRPVVEGLKWGEAAFLLYSKWKKKKPAAENEIGLQDKKTNIVPFKQS